MVRTRGVVLALALILAGYTSSAAETARIAIGEWPPYLSEELQHYGMAAHIAEVCFKAANVDVEVGFFPWNRVALFVENGLWDTSILWVKTEEREKVYLFSDVIFEGSAVFFYAKARPMQWRDYKDLVGLKFGGLMSASYPWFEAAKEQGINLEMEVVSDERLNFAKLLTGRIDAFSLDKYVGLYILHKNFPQESNLITYNPTPIESWPYRLIFTKNPRGEKMRNAFNKGLKIVQENGLLEQLLDDAANGRYVGRSAE
ncbi:substrate-binding periplasmic protein [Hahella sp. NBU794]|uniref:substrate-binding periplasmic protein n=1 Tax=Hahella sp. NBU794 TaxID=3422590 RepID=UPI003D6DD9EF